MAGKSLAAGSGERLPRHLRRTQHPGQADDAELGPSPAMLAEQPRFATAASEELLTGARVLRLAFARAPLHHADRGVVVLSRGDANIAAVQLAAGFGFSSCVLADGRRAILDILVPGDIVGLDRLVLAGPSEEINMVGRAGYRALDTATLRRMMADPNVAAYIMAIIAETRWRASRLAASIGRLGAYGRLCVLLLDLYDRLRRRGLISRPTYNLLLTQEQLADHLGLTLVHVNRTLRRLREERIAMVDRQVVIIQDMEKLRHYAQGLPEPADMPEPKVSV